MVNIGLNGHVKGKGVLFVGRSSDIPADAGAIIREAGGKLTFADDGFQALDRISCSQSSGNPINLIVMDYPLLEVSKIEMLAELLIKGINIPLLVIFQDSDSMYLEGFSSNFNSSYLVRPFTVSEFVEMIAELVS